MNAGKRKNGFLFQNLSTKLCDLVLCTCKINSMQAHTQSSASPDQFVKTPPHKTSHHIKRIVEGNLSISSRDLLHVASLCNLLHAQWKSVRPLYAEPGWFNMRFSAAMTVLLRQCWHICTIKCRDIESDSRVWRGNKSQNSSNKTVRTIIVHTSGHVSNNLKNLF